MTLILENMQKTATFAQFLGLNPKLKDNAAKKAALNELLINSPWRRWSETYPQCAASVRSIIEQEIANCDRDDTERAVAKRALEAKAEACESPQVPSEKIRPARRGHQKPRKDRQAPGGPEAVSGEHAEAPTKDTTGIS